MNARAKAKPEPIESLLKKVDANAPAIIIAGRDKALIKAGITFGERTFADDTPLPSPDGGFEPGANYGVVISKTELGLLKLATTPVGIDFIGGFHFAPGGNAPARGGGDSIPAINPFSIWDRNRRPANADPRGMFLIETLRGKSWGDIYPLAKDHMANGTSQFGATFADGNNAPQNPAGGYFDKLDYAVAVAVMAAHGKTLMSFDEFVAAAHGVTEITVAKHNPKITGLDAPRTSQRGMMMAIGNKWQWGDDGDPDKPRAAIFGGSYLSGGNAGSRYAYVGYYWPDDSNVHLGARGRGDHLQLD